MATKVEGAKDWNYFSLRECDWESLPQGDAILILDGRSVDIAPKKGFDFRVISTADGTNVEFLKSFLPDEIDIAGSVVIEDSQMPNIVVYKLAGPESVLQLKGERSGELRITNIPDFTLAPKLFYR